MTVIRDDRRDRTIYRFSSGFKELTSPIAWRTRNHVYFVLRSGWASVAMIEFLNRAYRNLCGSVLERSPNASNLGAAQYPFDYDYWHDGRTNVTFRCRRFGHHGPLQRPVRIRVIIHPLLPEEVTPCPTTPE